MKRQLLLYILVFLSHFCAIAQCEWKTTLEQDLYDSYDLTQHLDENPNDINAHRVLYELGEASRKDIDEIKFVSKYLPSSKEYQRLVSEIKTAGGYLKWKNIADVGNDLTDILKPLKVKYADEILNELTKDFPNRSDLKRVVNEGLIESWKVLSDGGLDDLIKRNTEALEIIDKYKNTVDSDLGKLTDKFKNAANKEDAFSEVITEVRRKARQSPGASTGNGFEINGQWMRGTDGNLGLFPKSVADKMKGKQFNNFDEFRTEFWKTVAGDPDLSSQFIPSNVTRMRNGSAPRVAETQQLGGRLSFEIHHKTPIHDGGGVYDIDNMVIVTPRYHKEILDPAYHFNK